MISIIILTKNEEKNIFDCLESALWADEIIIIDDNSTDRTIDVARNLKNNKIKIYKNNLNKDFSDQRNFGLSKATKDWVLYLDADERITNELRDEINAVIIPKNNYTNGYYLKRKDVIWGKQLNYGELKDFSIFRLAKRNKGKWTGKVHEIWNVEGKIDTLDNFLVHYPHQTITEFLNEINIYSNFRADELFEKNQKVKFWEIIVYPLGKLFVNYFVKLGFRDGIEGFIFALMMSFHSFLVRAKLWQKYL